MRLTGTFHDEAGSSQQPFDVAVVIPTVCRPSLLRAVRSVFAQSLVGRIQVLIGIDVARGERAVLSDILAVRPAHVAVTILDLGYSTSTRHGGLYPAGDGGALRTLLSIAANSRYVAYLDDDNWFEATHLARLLEAIQGRDWAFSYRWFVDPDTLRPLCVDIWESVGPYRGVFLERFGGFVDPNCLMIDKLRCGEILPAWSVPFTDSEDALQTADRSVFDALRRNYRWGASEQATSYYLLTPSDANHPIRMARMQAQCTAVGPLPNPGQRVAG